MLLSTTGPLSESIMCGRFSQAYSVEQLDFCLKNVEKDIEWDFRYNIAPQQKAAVLLSRKMNLVLASMLWGIVPYWGKFASNRIINARSETVFRKVTFKDAILERRCIIPVDGYFEWDNTKGDKQPYRIFSKNNELLLLAGLWNKPPHNSRDSIGSFAIVTTVANSKLSTLHYRMPVILRPEDAKYWLQQDLKEHEIIQFLKPANSDNMDFYAVSKYVNTVTNDNIDCIAPSLLSNDLL